MDNLKIIKTLKTKVPNDNTKELYFAAIRILESLTYGSDMPESKLLAIRDAKALIDLTLERVNK